jgi:hypothetical protein
VGAWRAGTRRGNALTVIAAAAMILTLGVVLRRS